MFRMLPRLLGREPASPTIDIVLVDPFARTIEAVRLPSYRTDKLHEPICQTEFKVFSEAINRCLKPPGAPTTSLSSAPFRYDCMAMIDDRGLLHDEAAYWQLAYGDYRPMRGGHYVIFGYDGTPVERSVPSDLGVRFWREHVRWVDRAEGRAWCREHGLGEPDWRD